jgi:hypothetical protein
MMIFKIDALFAKSADYGYSLHRFNLFPTCLSSSVISCQIEKSLTVSTTLLTGLILATECY